MPRCTSSREHFRPIPRRRDSLIMKFKGSLFAGLLAAALFFNAGSARAAAVTGQANIAGNVNVDLTSIIFNPTFTNTPGALETGSFAGLTGGTIMSLTGGPRTGGTKVPGFTNLNHVGGA